MRYYLIDRIIQDSNYQLIAVKDIDESAYEKLCLKISSPPPHFGIDEFPEEVDVFIECASVTAVAPVVKEAMKRNKTVIVASIGGMIETDELWDVIENSNGKLVLPSGAIGGLDILKALDKSQISEVSLTTRKNPDSLPSEYACAISETEIYCGSARDAIKRFPKKLITRA